ncbi:RagB/SusD family nutrient uptake outer membrane protein [Flavobacterium sp. M31R6]|uniref:RagB/SusD family nutrient uptake outer membrane protein n=1 Tax=Flavobacterium sp. M31R6 TaxID=2739062 RepID=UPI0015688396|nr:RagB/SusD family nutrient uptake outer membrane protein [Flavobacterium sp. M31R6]QKJ61636.1 RagB/SusD family nutrient uptake outer membrane protein [Flavobacterium sp. M31R6]
MKKIQIKLLGISLLMMIGLLSSCTGELDQSPESQDAIPGEEFYSNPASYKQSLAKLYAGFATTGQQGPAGKPDVSGDEGASQYIRGLWLMQELTTDEAVIGWNDGSIKDFHSQTWTDRDAFIKSTFYRISFQIVNCNEFLKQTSDAKLDARGVDAATKAEVKDFRAEVRFLRALSYWHLVDCFGGGSLVTEDSPSDFYYPAYSTRAELYAFIDSELTALTPELKAPKTNEAYRVDQAAAWMLQAKLYMNAKVYIGTDKYADALPLINKVIASPYTIHNNYNQLFYADNDANGAQNEFIFAIAFDGLRTQTYGGTTFLAHAPVGGSMDPKKFGINGGWGGVRTTSAFVDKFPAGNTDTRGIFWTDGQSKDINNISSFTDGYAVQKFRNVKVDGSQGSDATGNFVDIDFPIFRLADAYLMYAECAVRGSGNLATATTYVNALRTRAKTTTINQTDLTLDFILDERAREFHFEGQRRTDLVRFGKFTGGSYIWPWKGGVKTGSPTQSYRDVFPIPADAIVANQNLKQNPGY